MTCLFQSYRFRRPIYVLIIAFAAPAWSQTLIGERPSIEIHFDQADLEDKSIAFKQIVEHSRNIFDARFNELDGQGRPASTGGGNPRDPHRQPEFIRTSGPDANACSGCHNQPVSGGGGDFVSNVFVLAQLLDLVTDSTSDQFSNERNTLGMFGSGAIESLAREMSDDLMHIRNKAMGCVRLRALWTQRGSNHDYPSDLPSRWRSQGVKRPLF